MVCKNISIFYLKAANPAYTEFNLLETRKATVSEITKEINPSSNSSSFGL